MGAALLLFQLPALIEKKLRANKCLDTCAYSQGEEIKYVYVYLKLTTVSYYLFHKEI